MKAFRSAITAFRRELVTADLQHAEATSPPTPDLHVITQVISRITDFHKASNDKIPVMTIITMERARLQEKRANIVANSIPRVFFTEAHLFYDPMGAAAGLFVCGAFFSSPVASMLVGALAAHVVAIPLERLRLRAQVKKITGQLVALGLIEKEKMY